jgi:ligand-binding sensor domain-containing protein
MSRKFMEKIRSGSRLFFILSVWGGLINLGALGAHPLALLPPVISNEYLVVNFQSDQGLPRDSITSINQDHKGYLWLATPPYGLTRFDGIRFEPFGGEFSLALVRGEVWQILRDRDAGMWLSTRRSELLKLSDGRLQHGQW